MIPSNVTYNIISQWINTNSRVLDLACGDGQLLAQLGVQHQIIGYGLEYDPEKINQCINSGVNVIDHDLDYCLTGFSDASFDTVLMTDSLQVMHRPDVILSEMLRVGREAIITFPNFGNIKNRLQLMFMGKMPVTKQLRYQWYDTPNIHLFTLKDFEQYCQSNGYVIIERKLIAHSLLSELLGDWLPNLFASTAIYRMTLK